MSAYRLLRLAAAAWVARWALQELAAYASRHWVEHGPPPTESARPPGWMPTRRRKAPNE